jgi:hypothetical protein
MSNQQIAGLLPVEVSNNLPLLGCETLWTILHELIYSFISQQESWNRFYSLFGEKNAIL